MHSPVLATVELSVCLSDRLSHAGTVSKRQLGSWIFTDDSPRTLVLAVKSSSRNSKGLIPSEGVKWEWGRKNSQFLANKSPFLRNGARQDQGYY